jgi:uncharacterized protein related to proFAR isomerase
MNIVPYIAIEERSLFQLSPSKNRAFEAASDLSKRFDRLYLADFDGIFNNKPQLDIAQRISDELPTLYEGGVRYSNNVIDMLITGAERASALAPSSIYRSSGEHLSCPRTLPSK